MSASITVESYGCKQSSYSREQFAQSAIINMNCGERKQETIRSEDRKN